MIGAQANDARRTTRGALLPHSSGGLDDRAHLVS
jgi:hypothetical protein